MSDFLGRGWSFPPRFDPRDKGAVMVSKVDDVIEGGSVRIIDAAQKELPHASLGFTGGGTFETQSDDKTGRVAKRPVFEVKIEPVYLDDKCRQTVAWAGAPGERVDLRFTLPSKPLLWQWVDKLQKLVQGRAQL